MTCVNCEKPITEEDFQINCYECGDFCSEECYMQHHDKAVHKPKKSLN